MKTTALISAALLLSSAALAVGDARPAPPHRTPATALSALSEVQRQGRAPAVAPAYGWPVKPFDRQHPVRGFLNDPRRGGKAGGAFHFGIDVAAPDGTPVYAVMGGILYLSHGSLAVVSGPNHEFGYWHIRAAAGLRHRQFVRMHQLLGTIAPGWGHVHFAERVGDEYLNPLRPGGLGPYRDPAPPTVSAITVSPLGGGSFAVTARAYDTAWPRVPGPWAGEPVTPAFLRWRVSGLGRPAGQWHTVVDGGAMIARPLFGSVYAPSTRPNHEGRPGAYVYVLARRWQPGSGRYRIEVVASDTRGNTAEASLDVSVESGTPER